MSVRTEKLLEQINKLRKNITLLEETGQDASALLQELSVLNKEFQQANEVLTESKKVLKG